MLSSNNMAPETSSTTFGFASAAGKNTFAKFVSFETMKITDSKGRLLGYARVSTAGQDLEYQLARLRAAGCVAVFHEKRSGKSIGERAELRRLLEELRPGDVVLATATDRVARDPLDLLNVMDAVKASGAGLRLLDEPFVDTTSEMSDLVMFIVGWAARWHRKRILENTAHGRELARNRGVRFGRKPKLTEEQCADISRLRRLGVAGIILADRYQVSLSTILRVLAAS